MLSVSWSITFMFCLNVFPFICRSISKFLENSFYCLRWQCSAAHFVLWRLIKGESSMKWFSCHTLKGVIRLKMLLHVAMELVLKFKISCGMTLGTFMRGVMKLFIEKLNQLHYWDDYCQMSNWFWASKVCPDLSCTAYYL